MQNDIRPPRRPRPPVSQPEEPQTTAPDELPPVVDHAEVTLPPPDDQPVEPRRRRYGIVAVIGVLFIGLLASGVWYAQALSPVDANDDTQVRFEVTPGASTKQVASSLKDHDLIANELAFEIYARMASARGQIKAGKYVLKPSLSVPQIVTELTTGKTDEIRLTFLPGATVADAKKVLLEAGYDEAEIDAALAKEYDHPVFESKPASADLEGYIYGETYAFEAAASVEDILLRTFDELESVITDNNLREAYAAQELSLYEGITLASIIQREVSNADDQRQVSQVFHKRLDDGMPLGADATFVYAAKKLGVSPSVDLDSPYNTRKYGGLPPGPISAPGLTALTAVANPAEGDYLYFVSGDDGKNYFSRTLEEHEKNTRDHCKANCQLF